MLAVTVDAKPRVLRIEKDGPGEVTRRRHPGRPTAIEVLNPDHHICTCRQGRRSFAAELTVGTRPRLRAGRAQQGAARCRSATIPIDSLFSPIRKVNLHGHQRARRSADRLRQAHARGLDQRRGHARRRRRLRREDPEGPALDLHQLRRGERARPRHEESEEQAKLNENLFRSRSTSSSSRCARRTACRTPTSSTSASSCRRPRPRCSRPRTSAASRSRRSRRSSRRWGSSLGMKLEGWPGDGPPKKA